jgi:hypothetical protein
MGGTQAGRQGEAIMDYILYTSNAMFWSNELQAFDGPFVEFVRYKDADKTVVLEDVFAVNDSMQAYSFWLGAEADMPLD